MRLLDLFCCQGGAAMGYRRAGFDVTGVDIDPQPRYPFTFWQGDALRFLERHGQSFDAIHASPPCQLYTNAHKIRGNDHPDLIGPVRELLQTKFADKPWVIENVPGAPLSEATTLCGAMFSLGTYRHRLFESNVHLAVPDHPAHDKPTTKMGRRPEPGQMMHVVGNFSGVAAAKQAMGIDWMTRDGLRESIPPAYTEWVGQQLTSYLTAERAA